MPSPTGLTGAAGEYHVAAELSRRDWLATVTIKNAPGTDVLAQRRDRRTIVAIQTKTAGPGNEFQLGEKDELPGESSSEWYVLVSLGALEERPRFHILPRHVVAAMVYLEHRDWAENLGLLHNVARPGVTRALNPRRTIKREWIERYADRWDLLENPSFDAPFLGPPIFHELARAVPLPAGFPPLERPEL